MESWKRRNDTASLKLINTKVFLKTTGDNQAIGKGKRGEYIEMDTKV